MSFPLWLNTTIVWVDVTCSLSRIQRYTMTAVRTRTYELGPRIPRIPSWSQRRTRGLNVQVRERLPAWPIGLQSLIFLWPIPSSGLILPNAPGLWFYAALQPASESRIITSELHQIYSSYCCLLTLILSQTKHLHQTQPASGGPDRISPFLVHKS